MRAAFQTGRIAKRFAALKAEGRAGLVTFITAGDPNLAVSAEILAGLPKAGADLIELGMPFSDPMADGPSVQAAGYRALKAGTRLSKVLELAAGFRRQVGAGRGLPDPAHGAAGIATVRDGQHCINRVHWPVGGRSEFPAGRTPGNSGD